MPAKTGIQEIPGEINVPGIAMYLSIPDLRKD
jgi:hypothetical protein